MFYIYIYIYYVILCFTLYWSYRIFFYILNVKCVHKRVALSIWIEISLIEYSKERNVLFHNLSFRGIMIFISVLHFTTSIMAHGIATLWRFLQDCIQQHSCCTCNRCGSQLYGSRIFSLIYTRFLYARKASIVCMMNLSWPMPMMDNSVNRRVLSKIENLILNYIL